MSLSNVALAEDPTRDRGAMFRPSLVIIRLHATDFLFRVAFGGFVYAEITIIVMVFKNCSTVMHMR